VYKILLKKKTDSYTLKYTYYY